MIHFPDFTLPPINLYVMAQLKYNGHYQKKQKSERKEWTPDINQLIKMRNTG